jgi:hypothetical protein
MSTNQIKWILGLLAPLIAAAAAWLTAAVAKYGVHLDPSGVNAALVAGATGGLAVMVKLIHDVESKVDHDVDTKLPAPDAQLIDGVLKQLEPALRQAAQAAVQTEVLNLAHRIQPPAPAPAPGPAPTPASAPADEVTAAAGVAQAAAVVDLAATPAAGSPAEAVPAAASTAETGAGTANGAPGDPTVEAVRAAIAAAKRNGSDRH